MLLTVERERIYHRQWVRLDSNTGTVRIEVPQGIAPNAYITATLLRPLDDLDPHAPARAFGAVPLFIDRGPSTLPVEVRAPESMRPRSSLAVQVRLPDLPRDVPARITVAAVDEGILQLTDAATPSPLDFFHMRRSLVVGTYDTWAWLLPEYERVRQTSSPGGGLAENKMVMAGLADRLNPLSVPRVKPVALWSGLLDGTRTWQTIDFDVPEFNGTLRLMVVASAGTRFGSATEQVQVADPFVLTPSLPRFLAPGDAFRVPVAVYNGVSEPGVASPVRVELELSGPLALAESSARVVTLDVAGGQEEVVWFDLRATDAVGAASVTFTASGGTETVTRTIELPVRAPWPLEVTAQGGTVTEATPASVMAADRWYPGTGRTVVSVAANPIAGFGEALPYLLRYPYGCAEQRTSRAFPLLYFGNLAAQIAPESFTDGDADYYVNSGLDYLTALHRPGQGFALWPGPRARTTNPWASVYVTHFLVSARKAGYVVSEAVLDDALDHVAELARTSERGWSDGWLARYRLGTRCYAAYVLAVADRPEKGAMEELARNHWRDLPSSARTHLAGAYALIGNRARFDELLPAGEATEADRRSLGYTWSSRARDDAMALEVLATVDPEHPQVAGLIQRLSRRARNGRWHNTHENGWALLALGKLAGTGRIAPAEGEILVGGQVAATFDAEGASVSGTDWGDREIVVRATTPGTAWYTVRSQGIPRSGGESDIDAGLSLVRTYLDADGAPLDPRTLTQGQTVVCRLSLLSQRGRVSDVVVTDLVPAGLEIENPRLARTGGFDWLDEDRGNRMRLPQEHLEIRDDRLLLFTRADTREGVFYYTLRAVTAGRFVAPPAKAEAMYDPEVRSVGPIGEVNVVAP